MISSDIIYLAIISLLVLLLIRCWRSRCVYKKIAEDAVDELKQANALLEPIQRLIAERSKIIRS